MYRRTIAARPARILLLTASAAALLASSQAHAQQIEEVVVRGIRLSLEQAAESKRQSEAIVDVVSADDLGRLPDKNAAEAVARLPGVSITQDQGEGRYVSIRGASPNLNSVTLNGLAVGTVEENSRRVPFDILGGELLGSIEVVKAVTPDLEANAIGGFINVKTPSPYDYDDKFFGRGSASISDDEFSGFNPYAVNLQAGGKFGSAETIGILLGVSYTNRHYITKGLYVDDWREVAGIDRGAPEGHKFNRYDLQRERMTLTGNIEFKPDDDNLYYVRALWTDADESEIRYRNRNYFTRSADGVNLNGDGSSGSYTNQRIRFELRAEDKERQIGNFAVGGENTFNNLEIEYAASYIDNHTSEPNQNWVFQGNISSGTFDMAPDLFIVNANTADLVSRANEMGLNGYSTQMLEDDDKGWQGKLDVKYNLNTASFDGYIKAGGLFRSMKKTQDIAEDAYSSGSGGTTAFNAGLPGILSGDLLGGDVKGQFYQVGPRLSLTGLRDFTAANISNGSVLEFEAGDSLAEDILSDFETKEDILSAYVMGSATFGEWTVLGGVRLEYTDVEATSFDFVNGTTATAVVRGGNYTNILPSVHVTYRSKAMPIVLRGAWTNTLGRPEYADITARRVISRVESDPGVFDGSVSQGNPDLKAFESMNFDLSAEYYLDGGGLLSVAGFYKDIDGFIFNEVVTQTNVTFENQFYDSLVTTTPLNANSGTIKGAEFQYSQQFSFLPWPFNGLGASASLTLVDSKISVPGRTDKLPFIGQADTVYSITGFYQLGPFEAVLSYDWADDILVDVGGGIDGDFYDENYGRLDLRTVYRVTDNINVFLDVLNINNEALGEFQGRKTWISRKEVYGITGTLGASFRW